jgi:hypothetical protein
MIFNSKMLKTLLKKVGDELNGDWVLIGGTVLPALGVDHRATIDVDLIPIHNNDNEALLELMNLADSMNLPIESINSAGAFFLKKQTHFEQNLILLQKGKKGKIFRPDFFLFLKLKIARLSEQDLSDIIELLKFSISKDENISYDTSISFIKKEIAKCEDPKKNQRLLSLLKTLNAIKTK